MSVLVITAVDAERDAVLRDITFAPQQPVHVVVGGVGPVAAAVSTMAALADFPEVSLVVSAGIAGGFRGRIEVCDVAVANRVTFADIGARTDAGLLTLDQMGLHQDSSYLASDSDIVKRLARTSPRIVTGEILTLACMTGMDDDARRLAARHPHAIAEAMEGFGVAAAANRAGVPFAEIRAISNVIGKRDPSTWNMRGAFDALAQTFAELVEEPLP
jgi:futalosine hydrolase